MTDDEDEVSYAFDETQSMVLVAFQQNKLRIEDDKTLFKIDHIVCLDNGTVIMTKGKKDEDRIRRHILNGISKIRKI